jgi:hypothetical protein
MSGLVSLPCLIASLNIDTGYTKKNAGISGTCNLGMKTDMRALLAAFYSFFYKQAEKLLDFKICSSAHIPPIVHFLPDIWNCCSDLCFEFSQHIHSLAANLVFDIVLKKKVSLPVHGPGKFMCKQ